MLDYRQYIKLKVEDIIYIISSTCFSNKDRNWIKIILQYYSLKRIVDKTEKMTILILSIEICNQNLSQKCIKITVNSYIKY